MAFPRVDSLLTGQLKAEIIAYLTRPLLARSDKSSKMRNSDAGSVKN
jgi:hypothetical protein